MPTIINAAIANCTTISIYIVYTNIIAIDIPLDITPNKV